MSIAIIGTVASSLLGFRGPIISRLVQEGHTVYALAVDYNEKSRNEVSKLGAIPVSYSMQRYGLNPLVDIVNTLQLKRLLVKLDVDVVFSYFVKPVIYGTLAAKLAGIPKRIGMLEGLGYAFTKLPQGTQFKQIVIKYLQILLYKFSIPFLDRLIVLNNDDWGDLYRLGVRANKVSVLGGIGLDLNEYPFVPLRGDSNVSFLYIGRLLKEKGVELFLDAAEVIKAKYPNVKITLLGSVEPESSSSISLDRLNLLCANGLVDYVGQVADVNRYLVESSVFVLPSYREGFPRSTQEAMAVGRAVITTNVPGCRESVKNFYNGLIVPSHDVDALVEAMEYCINNINEVEIMGERGHEMAVKKFDVNKVNERLYGFMFD